MVEMRGDIATFLAAQGHAESDPETQAALDVMGTKHEVEDFPGTPATRYLTAYERGASIALEEGRVSAIHLAIQAKKSYAAYAGVAGVVEGISADSTREDILRLFGEPVKSTSVSDRYEVQGRQVRFGYEDGTLSEITVMARDPQAPRGGSDPKPPKGIQVQPEATVTVAGDVTTFVAALGLPLAITQAAGLIGEDAGRNDVERDGVAWQYLFTSDGVDYQFRAEALVGVLIHIDRAEGDVYPRPETLIAGLALPAAPADVRAALGTPAISSPTNIPGESFDLFNISDDHALSVDYREERTVSVTVLQRGVAGA